MGASIVQMFTSGRLFEITPDNDANLETNIRGLYIANGGDIRVIDERGQTVTFENVSSSAILPIRAVRVLATGTTASGIVGLG